MRITFRWVIVRARINSCLNRWSTLACPANSGRITFSATRRSTSWSLRLVNRSHAAFAQQFQNFVTVGDYASDFKRQPALKPGPQPGWLSTIGCPPADGSWLRSLDQAMRRRKSSRDTPGALL